MRKRFPCGGCRDGWCRRTVGRIIGCAGSPATSRESSIWRHLHMYRRGGVYLDFKRGLLQPLWRWLLELQNACMQHELGRQGEARAGAQCPPF